MAKLKDRLKLAKELAKQYKDVPMFSKPEGPIAKQPKKVKRRSK